MPGILPMKVIKVGASAQTRIAQACDRCRSKKIRCDGVRPSCSQCVNVGFECKTSDKLSRRAFPRGYTESLEERVRCLEAEVRELKDLLDEKDEKIDMLSRIRSHSPQTRKKSNTPPLPTPSPDSGDSSTQEKDDVFQVEQLVGDDGFGTYIVGNSSGKALFDAFRQKVQETGVTGVEANAEALTTTQNFTQHVSSQTIIYQAPARLVSDQLVNIFFQEWAPLFPILHRPTFLHVYEDYVSCPEAIEDKIKLAQLNLVFSIAGRSSYSYSNEDLQSFDAQWQSAIGEFLLDSSLDTLKCLLLAQISCLQTGDRTRLSQYKSLAISLSHTLGLHRFQKRSNSGALTSETRKKLFWTLYTLDCFSAAQFGLSRMLKDNDIHCELPVDVDDENVTETGFLPSLPGEFTKLSSALALFKVCKVLGKIVDEIYPSSESYELTYRQIANLSEELDQWSRDLPAHLRLQFVQDKPSTGVISSRSPLLSLAYHYIRSLIFRPALYAIAASADTKSSANVAIATSSKHIVQIIQLLEERNLAFSFCLQKNELLTICGVGLMFQSLDLEQGGALNRDNHRLISVISSFLGKSPSPASIEFRRIAHSLAKYQNLEARRMHVLSRHNSDSNLKTDGVSSAQKHIRAIMSRFSSNAKNSRLEPMDRRATLPAVRLNDHFSKSQASLSSIRSEPSVARSEPTFSPPLPRLSQSPPRSSAEYQRRPTTNLDFLPLGSDARTNSSRLYRDKRHTVAETTDWERLLGSLDNGQTNIYDGIYGGPPIDALLDVPPLSSAADTNLIWSPDVWAVGGLDGGLDSGSGTIPPPVPQSVLSFSDESLTSGEDFPDLSTSTSNETFRGILIPEMSPSSADGHGYGLAGLDGNFGL